MSGPISVTLVDFHAKFPDIPREHFEKNTIVRLPQYPKRCFGVIYIIDIKTLC